MGRGYYKGMADQILQEIKDKIDVVELVGTYVKLKKAGTNYKGLCPFHYEKTGSFMISPAKQIWHCFGCGLGGDVFEFTKRIENVEFKEALKLLADRAGVKLPEYSQKNRVNADKEERYKKINAFAAEYYHQILLSKSGEEARKYLEKRGLSKESIKKWQIGYAPAGFHNLESALAKKKIAVADLLEAGVSAKNEAGKVYDRFRERITFPILNYMGECVGFSARVLRNGNETAKYINSPETLIYNKSRVLFGLNFAKNEIRKKDYALLVEGQMDCIQAQEAGFSNCVATSGTALTKEHIELIKRLTGNILLCFDSDEAGEKAQRRAIELILPFGLSVKVVRLKGFKDADEMIQSNSKLFSEAIKNSEWAIDYYLNLANTLYTFGSLEQKKYIQSEVVSLVNLLTNKLEQEHYIQKIITDFKISHEVLMGFVSISQEQPVLKSHDSKIKQSDVEKEILGGVLVFGEMRNNVFKEYEPGLFSLPEVEYFFKLGVMENGEEQALQEFLNSSFAKEAIFMVELRLQEKQQNKEAVLGELLKSFYLHKISFLKSALRQAQLDMKTAENQKDLSLLKKATLKYQSLSLQRQALESKV